MLFVSAVQIERFKGVGTAKRGVDVRLREHVVCKDLSKGKERLPVVVVNEVGRGACGQQDLRRFQAVAVPGAMGGIQQAKRRAEQCNTQARSAAAGQHRKVRRGRWQGAEE